MSPFFLILKNAMATEATKEKGTFWFFTFINNHDIASSPDLPLGVQYKKIRKSPFFLFSSLTLEAVAKDIRATVGCAVRTILNNELRLPNGAHGAPYLTFTTPPPGEGWGEGIKKG